MSSSETVTATSPCTACDQFLPDQTTLSCGHVYCRKCIGMLIKTRQEANAQMRCCMDAKEDIDPALVARALAHLDALLSDSDPHRHPSSPGQADAGAEAEGEWVRRFVFCGRELSVREDWRLGIGGSLWNPGLVLAAYLEQIYHHQAAAAAAGEAAHPRSLQGLVTVELGSGCGVTGMVAALLGARVTLTDLPEVVPNLAVNVRRNVAQLGLPKDSCTAVAHPWGEGVEALPHPCDLVLLADVMYDPSVSDALLASVSALSDDHTVVLVSHQHRNNSAAERFFAGAVQCGFSVDRVDISGVLGKSVYGWTPSHSCEGIFRMQRRPTSRDPSS